MFKSKKISAVLLLLIILLSVLSVAIFNQITFKKKSQSLNLILISVDTLRADHMGVYGYEKNTTPNIDEWAKDAFVFDNVTTTVPVTYPSFTSLFTGLSPFDTRINNNIDGKEMRQISDNVRTLPRILRQYGYTNVAFVSNPATNEYTNMGFDKYYDFDWPMEKNGEIEKSISDALLWLDQNQDKKMFLWIHLFGAHAPYAPPKNMLCEFEKKYCSPQLKLDYEELEKERESYSGWPQGCDTYKKIPKDRKEFFEDLYDAGIYYSDSLVKQILDKLSQTGLDKKSLIIFYGDHGEGFDHNFYFNHSPVLYQSAINIPLIIKNPLIEAKDKKVSRMIQNTDILPTVLDLLGVSNESLNIDGKSFSDVFYNSFSFLNLKRQDSYSVNHDWTRFSITDGRYKYIYTTPYKTCLYNNRDEELYDLKQDPQETINLMESKQDIGSRLREQLFNYLSPYNLPQEYLPEIDKYTDKLKSL